MTYCRPQWISEFSFSKALNHRYHERGRIEAAAYSASDRGLLLWGGLYGDKDLFLEPGFVVNAPPSLPRMDGPYRLTGEAGRRKQRIRRGIRYGRNRVRRFWRIFRLHSSVEPDWPGRLSRITFPAPKASRSWTAWKTLPPRSCWTAPRGASAASSGIGRSPPQSAPPLRSGYRNRTWRFSSAAASRMPHRGRDDVTRQTPNRRDIVGATGRSPLHEPQNRELTSSCLFAILFATPVH